jgi:hypothetical protein
LRIALKSFIAALMLVFPLISCQSQGPLSPTPPHPVTVQITGPSSAYFAQQGEFRVAAFDVRIRELTGRPAVGVPVRLVVRRGPGEIIPSDAYSDNEGRIRALYAVFVPPEDAVAQIGAVVYNDTSFCSIKIPAGPVPSVEEVAPGFVPLLQKLLDDMIEIR